jgi:hypothetical protein
MCELDYLPSKVAECLTNIETALHGMGRQVAKGVVFEVNEMDRDALQCGSDLCRLLAVADLTADLPALKVLRDRGIQVNQAMLSTIAEACEKPYGRPLVGLAVRPELPAWCEHLRELASPIREQGALETVVQLAATDAENAAHSLAG